MFIVNVEKKKIIKFKLMYNLVDLNANIGTLRSLNHYLVADKLFVLIH